MENIHNVIERNTVKAFENNLTEFTLTNADGKILHISEIFFEHTSDDVHLGFINAKVPSMKKVFSMYYNNAEYIDKFTGKKQLL